MNGPGGAPSVAGSAVLSTAPPGIRHVDASVGGDGAQGDAGAGDECSQEYVARAGEPAVAAGSWVQTGLDQRAAGLHGAGHLVVGQLAVGAQITTLVGAARDCSSRGARTARKVAHRPHGRLPSQHHQLTTIHDCTRLQVVDCCRTFRDYGFP